MVGRATPVFTLRRPSPTRGGDTGPFTYPEVGATRHDRLPAGYHHLCAQRRLGRGAAVFDAAKQALRTWEAHGGAGILVGPPLPELVPGAAVRMLVRLSPLWVAVNDRIVWVVDTEREFGFAYGTLAAHAEVGEESFVVGWFADDTVAMTVRAFSRQGHWLSRLGAPVSRLMQARATNGYLDGVAAAVARSEGPAPFG